MYRSNIQIDISKSDVDSSCLSIEENKENISAPISANEAGESITEIFQKLSIKDRNSVLANNNTEIGFTTSSPIRPNSSLHRPRFMMTQATAVGDNFLSNTNVLTDYPEFIKTEPTVSEDNFLTSTHMPNLEMEIKADKTESKPLPIKKPLHRALTILNGRKPPIIKKENNIVKQEKVEPMKCNIKRTASFNHSVESLNAQKTTVAVPFSFENKDKAMLEKRKEMLLNDILEKKRLASSFRANPMLILSQSSQDKIVIKTTRLTEDRLALIQEKNRSQSKLNESVSSNLSRSKDISYMYKSPFKPVKAEPKLTVPETPMCNLKMRTERWKEIEEERRMQEEEKLRLKNEMDEEKKEKERLEVQKIRKDAIFRANSIKKFKSVDIVKNSKTTVPQTPKFSDRFKKKD